MHNCGKTMNREIKYEDSISTMRGYGDGDSGLFVSKLTSYIVTDDLHVIPNSPGSSIELLYEHGIIDLNYLESMSFDIGVDQFYPDPTNSYALSEVYWGLEILDASMRSYDALTESILKIIAKTKN
ncbi:hypothetical protein L1987_27935 [Smallanthus sonchifolius]|uniref:Uncharacterized protein n=1 Tax=Smallanthus sonchifolius TaxID=185202 RepID=A0ACB9ICE1_9ASTR|nr:hypothetical protein L1987_27935 [Smallanthus sonchifolius]